MIQRLITFDDTDSILLFGARGTGKTTLLHSMFDKQNTLFIDLLDPIELDRLIRTPQSLSQQVKALPPSFRHVVIDEVQKAPRLLDIIHHLIESTDLTFILTGSSSRKLKRGTSNLLAGRAFINTLHPFTSLELGEKFDLKTALKWGMLPAIYNLPTEKKREIFLRSYALTYLKEEIQEEQLIRNLDPFRHFLEVAAQANGRIVNYSRTADDIKVDTKTVISYFSILEDTLIGHLLQPYHKSIRKRQRQNPKFYLIDTGIKRALDRTLTVDIVEKTYAFGNAFEHFLITEIIKLAAYKFPDWRFSYLMTPSGVEIDLIIDRPGLSEVLIEIKSTEEVTTRDVSALSGFSDDFPVSDLYCISRDRTRKKTGTVLCLHWQDALKELELVS